MNAVQIGMVIATFLLNTRRIIKGMELLKECLVVISNIAMHMGKENQIVKKLYIVVYDKVLHGYVLIGDLTSAIECGRNILVLLRESGSRYEEGRLTVELAKLYQRQNKQEKAKEFFMSALRISTETRDKELEGVCYGSLGIVFLSVAKYDKAEGYLQKALKIRIEIGDKQGEAAEYENLGTVFNSLRNYDKAEEYLQKALKIRIEIGDKEGVAAVYGNLGTVFNSFGKYDKAEEYHQKALKIHTEIGDKEGEAADYGNLGRVFHSLGKFERAKDYLQKAIKILIEIGKKSGEAAVYGNLGIVYQSLREYENAKDHFQKALKILIETGNKIGETTVYEHLGTVFQSLNKYEKAEEYFQKALKIRIEIGDKGLGAAAYENLGTLFHSIGEHKKAEEYLQKALAIRIEIGDKEGEAVNYGNLGNVFQSLGEYDKAEEYHQKTLKIQMEIGDKRGEATAYGNLGVVFQTRGEYEKARNYHLKALKIQMEMEDKRGEATAYGNLGVVFQYLGKHEKAEDCLQKALEIRIEIGVKSGEAADYGNLGAVYQSLGEYKKAEEFYQKALQFAVAVRNKRQEAANCGNLGTVFQSLGAYEKAAEYYQKALKIRIEIGDKNGQATDYGNQGVLFHYVGEYKKAEEYLQKALEIRIQIGDKTGEATACANLGSVYFSLGEYSTAKEYQEKALYLACKVGYTELQFRSHLNLTLLTLYSATGNFLEAVSSLFKCIEKSEEMRRYLRGNDRFKISFLDIHVSPYKLLMRLLTVVEKFNEAVYITELSHARALADMMSDQYAVKQERPATPHSWLSIERIIPKEVDYACLYISYHGRDLFLWILKPFKPVFFRLKDINNCLSAKGERRTVDEVFGDVSFRNFLSFPTQESCEDRSLFSSNASCLTPSRPVEEDEDEDQYSEPPSLTQCHKMIIDPVADLLDQPEIIIVPEGLLYNIPFAALRNENGNYLSESFRIRVVPSLMTLKLIQDSSADYHSQTGALIVGDPDVGEVKYKGHTDRMKPLPCAREEAEMIGRLLGVQPLLGKHATKQAVLHDLNSVSLIHFAAHGDAERGEIALAPPQLYNGIPQEEDYLLTVAEIAQVRLRSKLVVLSCCHSAKGEIRSEGVVGIARAFLGSGARSVLVSLWAIEDEATMKFMSHFYEHLVVGVSASESLHQAMKWMRSNGFSKVDQWAPFMLIGDNVTFNFGK